MKKMFEICGNCDWVDGFCGWGWHSSFRKEPAVNKDYSVYGKPVTKIIRDFYAKWRKE